MNLYTFCPRLRSVADPVIQATERSEFEDCLGSGDYVSGYSDHVSVPTGLPDLIKQTKFQRPCDVETPVPSITEVKSNIGTNADQVLYHIVRN
jgi:hypothetical protein